MDSWAALETPLDEAPLFPVQEPDGKKGWPEAARQATFFRTIHLVGPKVIAFPVPNAGKRNPLKAVREGIYAGVFDILCLWTPIDPLADHGRAAIELKGYDKRGQPGKLRQSQIDFGNRLARAGIPCACFFDPVDALNWLRECGAPVREARIG